MTVVASKYARVANDLYQTEPWATQALVRFFPVAGLTIWEPAAGNHLMAGMARRGRPAGAAGPVIRRKERMTEKDLKELADAARARVEAMSPEDQAAHWEAQRSSFVRGMTTRCEHGELDFEQCPQCRAVARR